MGGKPDASCAEAASTAQVASKMYACIEMNSRATRQHTSQQIVVQRARAPPLRERRGRLPPWDTSKKPSHYQI